MADKDRVAYGVPAPDTMPCDRCGSPRVIGHWRLWPCVKCEEEARKVAAKLDPRTAAAMDALNAASAGGRANG